MESAVAIVCPPDAFETNAFSGSWFEVLRDAQCCNEEEITSLLRAHCRRINDIVQRALDSNLRVAVPSCTEEIKSQPTVTGKRKCIDSGIVEEDGVVKPTTSLIVCEDQYLTGSVSNVTQLLHDMEEAETRMVGSVYSGTNDTALGTTNATDVHEDSAQAPCLGGVRMWFQEVAKSHAFALIAQAAIILNTIFLGIVTDWEVQGHGDATHLLCLLVDFVFTALFVAEIVVRMVAEGLYFIDWKNTEIRWNVFDVVVIASTLLENILSLTYALSQGVKHTGIPNLYVLRLVRTLRVLKGVKIIRILRFFIDFRLMIRAILGSAKPLAFMLVLLLVLMFSFTVCLLQIGLSASAEFEDQGFKKYFGTVLLGMYTLFMVITGGEDWGKVADEIDKTCGRVAYLVFLIYVWIAIFCVLNIVTSIFVKNIENITMFDKDKMIIDHYDERRATHKELKTLFLAIDKDGDGKLSWLEFLDRFRDARVQICFRNLGFDFELENAQYVFDAFDCDNDGYIDVHELATGIFYLHGNARSLDVFLLKRDTECRHLSNNAAFAEIDMRLDRLSTHFEILLQRLSQNGSTTVQL